MISIRDATKITLRLDNKPVPANFSRTEGSFQFSGPNIWNNVPYEIRCLTDIEVFKKSLKTYYFYLAFSDVD